MGKLLLDSLEIQNFRGFRHLQIEKLGRVNLLVGRNNVGKTALLEALHLYAHKNVIMIWEMLQARDELNKPFSQLDFEDLIAGLKYLFFGWKDLRKHSNTIFIGPMNSPNETLKIFMEWGSMPNDEKGITPVKSLSYEEMTSISSLLPRLRLQFGNIWEVGYPITLNPSYGLLNAEGLEVPSIFISTGGLKDGVVALWDGIALTAFEKDVIAALCILAPGVEGINFIGDAPAKRRNVIRNVLRETAREATATHDRIPIVKIAGEEDPVPLRSLGNGMLHMLDIVLALANARDGILLVDEIENGIHYSAQQELWQMVFRLASRLNVQVFATTHSWDCIEAFQKAAEADQQEMGMLIRLSLKKEGIQATLFNEEELQVVTRERIEVR